MNLPFNQAIRILLATNGLVRVAGAMLGPIYALFVSDIGGSLLDASYAFAIFALAAGITTLISGKYSDKITENEYVVILGYIMMAVGFLGYLFVDSMGTLLVVQIIIGIAEAIYFPAYDALYSKHLDKDKFAREWGAWEAMNYFAITLGAVIGGVLVTLFGFDIIFILMSLLCFVSAIWLFLVPRKII